MRSNYLKISLVIAMACTINSCYFFVDKREKLPSFDVVMLDSTTIFNTERIPDGKPFILLYFSPDCDHCHKQVDEILDNMSSFKNIQFYFFSPFKFELLTHFSTQYHLNDYSNITVAYDHKFFIPSHFKTTSTPCIFIYDEDRKLSRTYEGEVNASDLLDAIK